MFLNKFLKSIKLQKLKDLMHKRIGGSLIFGLIVILLIGVVFLAIASFDYEEQASNDSVDELLTDSNSSDNAPASDCNVEKLSLTGTLVTYYDGTDGDYTYSEWIVSKIEEAQKNDKIKAIILEIDSSGGWPVAGEEIMNALINSNKTTVALIRQGGLSSAYMAAVGADKIFASRLSDVGSIGVTISYLDNVNKNNSEGAVFNQLSSGKYKDMLSPDKPLTQEERALIMRDLAIIHRNFIGFVATNRNLSVDRVTQMADGSSMLGEMALKNGLIDEIGGMNEVLKYLKEQLATDPVICKE